MDSGVLALAAVFAVAGVLLVSKVARSRAVVRQLLAAGFAPCDEEAPALRRILGEVAGGHPPARRRVYEIGRCFKRPGGWGMLYRIGVADVTNAGAGGDTERQHVGARLDFYLLDLPDPERVCHGAVSVYLAPSAPGVLQRMLAVLVKSDPVGVPLELDGAHARAFLAAFSDRPGKLGERLPPATQERLAKAVDQGWLAAHFGAGKLALCLHPERRDLDRQLAYLAEWA